MKDDVVKKYTAYERWVDEQVEISRRGRADKHALMAADLFRFFRGSYALWAWRVQQLHKPAPGPVIDMVGDLHIENFGTWRDVEDRTVWGVNDLDEADRGPAAQDLARLAVSVQLADGRLSGHDVVDLLLHGYLEALRQNRPPTVVERPDPPKVASMLPAVDPASFWRRLLACDPVKSPDKAVVNLVDRLMPPGTTDRQYLQRIAGMGSRDRLRVVAVADFGGAPVTREVKAVPAPATRWVTGAAPVPWSKAADRLLAAAGPTRCPEYGFTDGWAFRRLVPWHLRIEIQDQHRAGAEELLHAAGSETAVMHRRGAGGDAASLRELGEPAARRWLREAVDELRDVTERDWTSWRHHYHGSAQAPSDPPVPSAAAVKV